MPEMEHHPRRAVVTVEQIRPRTNREGQVPIYHEIEDPDLSAPGMASSLPQIVSEVNLERHRCRFYTRDRVAQAQQIG